MIHVGKQDGNDVAHSLYVARFLLAVSYGFANVVKRLLPRSELILEEDMFGESSRYVLEDSLLHLLGAFFVEHFFVDLGAVLALKDVARLQEYLPDVASDRIWYSLSAARFHLRCFLLRPALKHLLPLHDSLVCELHFLLLDFLNLFYVLLQVLDCFQMLLLGLGA